MVEEMYLEENKELDGTTNTTRDIQMLLIWSPLTKIGLVKTQYRTDPRIKKTNFGSTGSIDLDFSSYNQVHDHDHRNINGGGVSLTLGLKQNNNAGTGDGGEYSIFTVCLTEFTILP